MILGSFNTGYSSKQCAGEVAVQSGGILLCVALSQTILGPGSQALAKVHWVNLADGFEQWFPTRMIFTSQGTLAMTADIFGSYNGRWGRDESLLLASCGTGQSPTTGRSGPKRR